MPGDGAIQVDLRVHEVEGDGEGGDRYQQGGHNEEEQRVPAPEIEPGETVPGHG